MAVDVYGWPPVGTLGHDWTIDAPTDSSVSPLTGFERISANQPERRMASLVVSSLGLGRMGAGYVESLKRLLKGRQHLVRLTSYPVNWYLDAAVDAGFRQSQRINWTADGVELGWTDGAVPLHWYDGSILQATDVSLTSNGFPAVRVTGLPPSRMVARPGEFVTVFADVDDTTGTTVQVMAPAMSGADGAATIRLFEALPNVGRINLGTSETRVFRPVGDLPRSMQPLNADWTYSWEFREVFPTEVGGFTEVPLWWEAT